MFSPLEQFDAIKLISLTIYNHDLTFFSILIPLIILIIFTYFLSSFGTNFTIVPVIIQSICEKNIEFIFDSIKQQIGKEGYIFLPFIFTLFNFVLGSNLLSLLPFGTALTSHLIIIL
jgi:F0F1-type ATP synthase membrane subunit a